MPTTPDDKFDKNTNGLRVYTRSTINQAFNDFLDLRPSDQKILQRHHDALMQNAEEFAKVFYEYLMASPATARVLTEYQKQGGQIEDLVKKQLQHLFGFLTGKIDDASAERMAQIGVIHHRFGVEPVWIMGAYKLYLEHLQNKIREITHIDVTERTALENTVTRLLFRDMGLMLEGYWDASLLALYDEKLKVSDLQNQITSLLANIPQLLWSIDIVKNEILYVSPGSRKICNMEISMPIPCMGWTIEQDRAAVEAAWQRALEGHKVEVESRVQQPDGALCWFRRVFYPYKNDDGVVVRIDGLMEDTTEAKSTLERLNTLATTDSLTGLTNRTLFHDRLGQAIASMSRSSESHVVAMLMDLNHFKEINDTLGHPAGDAVLINVARRLQAVLRQTDTLARLGGDEFGILMINVNDSRRAAERMANQILQTFITPFDYDEHELFLSASIGIAICPEHGDNVSTLMSRADVAMYSAKRRDVGYVFYEPDLDPKAQQMLQLSGALRHALTRNELELHYQPKIDMSSNIVTGVEALLRWRHPQHGLIYPDQFIPMAEHTGLIRSITDWVLETAMSQCELWRKAGYDLTVAINVSARALQDINFIDKINNTMIQHGLDSGSLEIEITENVLMSDVARVSTMLKQISDLGVYIAIDDFGTGYSSLSYLKALPLHTLKIDKSFVLDMVSNEDDAAIVHSTVDLAHNLGLTVVAEGIENSETLEMLRILGCDGAQGHYYSPSLPPEEFMEWLRQSRWL